MNTLRRLFAQRLGSVFFVLTVVASAVAETPGIRLEPAVVRVLPAEESEDDGYWPWLVSYRSKRSEAHRRIDEIRFELGLLAQDVRSLRAQWLRYLYLDNQTVRTAEFAPGWSDYFDAWLETDSVDVEAEIEDAYYRWTGGFLGAPIHTRGARSDEAVVGASATAAYRRLRDQTRSKINATEARQRALIDEALSLHRALEESARGQAAKSGDRRPSIGEELGALEGERPLVELELYDAAEWYRDDQLDALVEKVGGYLEPLEEQATLVRAKRQLALAASDEERIQLQLISPLKQPPDSVLIMASRTARLEAVLALRRVLEINPNNAEARQMLRREEMDWIERLSQRVQREKQLSMGDFHSYLSARGFPTDDPASLWDAAYDYAVAMWGMGPIALSAGIVGLPEAQAEATAADQMQAARHLTSLMTVAKLLRNGVPLTEIPSLSREQFEEAITLRSAGGRALPGNQATVLFVELKQTLADLPALARLASRDPVGFVEEVNLDFGGRFYKSIDPSYQSYEWFGDLLNVKNVVTIWGPGAVVRAGGQFAGQRVTGALVSGSELAAAPNVTVVDAVVRGARLDRMAQALGATATGRRLAASWRTLASYRQAGGATGALNTSAQLTAAGLLFGGVSVAADQYNVPGGALLVDLLAEMTGSQLLTEALSKGATRLDDLLAKTDEFAQILGRTETRLAEQRALADEIREFVDAETVDMARTETVDMATATTVDMARATTVDVARLDTISARLPPPPPSPSPLTGASSDSIDNSLRQTVDALETGDASEATLALTAVERMLQQAEEGVESASRRLASARQALRSTQNLSPSSVAASSAPIDPIDLFETPPDFWQPDLYRDRTVGPLLRAGDLALQDGDFIAAAENFRSAADLARQRPNPGAFTRHLTLAEERLALVAAARRDRNLIESYREAMEAAVVPDITDSTVSGLLTRFDNGLARPVTDAEEVISRRLGEGGGRAASIRSANAVSEITGDDGLRYVVKRALPKGGESVEELEQVLAMEAACAELARLSGIPASPTRYLPDRGLLITRAVDNPVQIANLPESTLVALKDDYARQRAFRAWIGDSDGHFGNQLVSQSGRLVQIDFDLATFTHFSRHIAGAGGDAEGLLWTVSTIHQSYRSHGPYGWIARMDELTRFEDMRETVEQIVELASVERSLQAAGGKGPIWNIVNNAGYKNVDEAVEVLLQRADKLEEVLTNVFDKQLVHLGAVLGWEVAA